jgi:putative transport protein
MCVEVGHRAHVLAIVAGRTGGRDAAVLSGDYVPPDGFTVEGVRSTITTAYAITYIFGLVGLILIIRLLPGVLGIDLADEAVQLERKEAAVSPQPVFSPSDIIVRAVRVEAEEFTGRPLEDLYSSSPVQFTIQ